MLYLFQVVLAWPTIGVYYSAISAFLEPHHLHKASNHPAISKLMHHFYLQCPAASAALVAGVSLVFILQAGDWSRVSTLARHYFSPYITTMDWHQDSV